METQTEIKRLLWDMAMWDFNYRNKRTRGKSAKELKVKGWEKDCEGNWCHKKMEKTRSLTFKKRNDELLLQILLQ